MRPSCIHIRILDRRIRTYMCTASRLPRKHGLSPTMAAHNIKVLFFGTSLASYYGGMWLQERNGPEQHTAT